MSRLQILERRKAFTLVEALVVLAIIMILGTLVMGAFGGCGRWSKKYYSTKQTDVYQCVKTYTLNVSEQSSTKRVDLRPINGVIVTMACDDDVWAEVRDSATLFAQFESGRWYSVSSVGFREGNIFPIVTAVQEVSKPLPEVER